MIYVTSDLHGRKQEFNRLLKKIAFSDQDEMYVLGDVLDRGVEPIPLVMQIMNTPNIHLLMGNHELYASLLLDNAVKTEPLPEQVRKKLMIEWSLNGGFYTAAQYRTLDAVAQCEVLSYLKQRNYCQRLSVNGKNFVLAHTDMPAVQDSTDTSYWHNLKGTKRIDYRQAYFRDSIFVSGHTPTARVSSACTDKIFQNEYHINVDCGARVLGCICLDTLKEYYV